MADMTFSIAGGKAVRPALLGAAGATLLGAFVAWDVLFPVLHYGHSTHIDLIRQMAMDAAYEEGQVYPRWAADFYFGRGSPIFNFYAPLAYLIGELFSLLGVSALGAIKGSYFLGVIVAAIAANRLARELWDTASGVAGAALLLLSPYFLLDLYVRGALAELWGMALLALALAFTIRAARTGQTHDATRAGAATALLLYAHNIAALLGVPVIFLAGLVAGDGRTARRRTLTALALGVAMGAAFWAPALFEKGLVRADENLLGGDYDFRRHFVPVRDLLHDEWGYGSPMAGPEPMATTLGALHLLVIPLAFIAAWRERRAANRRAIVVVALIAVLSLFMCTRASAVFWEYVPLLPFVQFPYRFLMLATVACAALAGAPSALAREKLGVAGAAGAAIVVVSAAFLLHGAKVQARYIFHDRADPGRIVKVDKAAASLLRLAPHVVGADELLTRETLREARETRATARDDYLPIGVSRKPDRYEPNLVEVIDGQAEANPFAVRGTHFEIDIRADTPARVLVHKFYFPGWTARDDGRVLTSLGPHDPTGEIVFSVPAGRHRVTVSFEDTRTRLWAKLASLAAASAAVLWIGLTQFSARRRGRRSYDRAGAD